MIVDGETAGWASPPYRRRGNGRMGWGLLQERSCGVSRTRLPTLHQQAGCELRGYAGFAGGGLG
jgi:hypothetical protein